jgi:predicted nucleotidyltransferase
MIDSLLIDKIRASIKTVEPKATAILYGSWARGDQNDDSDIDVLVLLDQKHVTPQDEMRVKYPLYELEFETGRIISPLVLSRYDWENRHRITPFFRNIKAEGIVL